MSRRHIFIIGLISIMNSYWLCAQITLIADINPGEDWSHVGEMIPFNGELYFYANNGSHGGLHSTDGTTISLRTDVGDAIYTNELTKGDGFLAWAGRPTSRDVGNSIWYYTPTEYYGLGSFNRVSRLVEYQGDVFFAGTDFGGTELYRLYEDSYFRTELIYDREEEGFLLGSLAPSHFTKSTDGLLYFLVWSSNSPAALWRTDGTEEGTYEVYPFPYFNRLYTAGGKLFLHGHTSPLGNEESTLWISDGTTAGTDSLENIRFFLDPYVLDSLIYFRNYTPLTGSELWVTDGTQSGTHIVDDYTPGSTSTSDIKVFGHMGNQLFLSGIGPSGPSLFVSELGSDTIQLVRQLEVYESPGVVLGDYFYFAADDFEFGRELWRTDGTEAGTEMLGDINPVGNSNPARITAYNGLILFVAYTDDLGFELYKYVPEGDTNCGDHIELDGIAELSYYSADSSIISGQWIRYNENIEFNDYYYSSFQICLMPGFEVDPNASFTIEQGGCDE